MTIKPLLINLEEVVSTESRSPLHERALMQADLVPERVIVHFNIHHGGLGEFTVVDNPFDFYGRIAVRLQNIVSGEEVIISLSDMGVVPRETGEFSRTNFVIDQSDRDILPEPVPYKLGEGPNAQGHFWYDD